MGSQYPIRIAVAALFMFCMTQQSAAQAIHQNGVVALPVINARTGEVKEMAVFEIDDNGVKSGIRITSDHPNGAGMSVLNVTNSPNFSLPDPWKMLSNPSVQKDLELVANQLTRIQDLQTQFTRQMQGQINEITKGGLFQDRRQETPALMDQLRHAQRKAIEDVLLPHQLARLKQVAFQTNFTQSGVATALSIEKVAGSLGITHEQLLRLRSRNREINVQLEKDISALRKKARNELLNELTPTQKDELKALIGDKFEPHVGDWQNTTIDSIREPQFQRKGK